VHVSRGEATQSVLSKTLVEYPEPGVLLVKLDPGDLLFSEYFSVFSDEPTVGQRIMAGGYGVDGAGESGRLRFIVEEVESLDERRIVITAHGRGGMCNGDSGSPILARRPDGVIAALGLLLGGSRSCRGTDVFIRTKGMLPWLMKHTTLADPAGSCGTLSVEGRCFEGAAMWCDAGELVATPCPSNTRCGYDTGRAGYRCVSPGEDPCDGADGFGACDGNFASTCEGGRLARVECRCETSCGYDTFGRAACF
jgi:hypothetical protein